MESENAQTGAENALTDYFIMEWIDIREKRPPCDENVIVHFRGQGPGTVEIKYLPEKKAGYHHGWYPGGRDIESATHWMPLPPLPEN